MDIKARAQIGGKMEIPEIMCYVGRIVQVVLKNGDYHIGFLDYHEAQQKIWGISPAFFSIGKARFAAKDVKHVFISIGGDYT